MRSRLLMFAILVACSASAVPQPVPPVKFAGFVDGYFAWNQNRPADRESFVAGTGTSAKRANEFALNLVEVEASRDAAPVGFRLSLVAGKGTDVLHAGEPHDGIDTYRHIYEASVTWKATDKLTLQGGIFPSHIGMEGFFSKDNWNYTRSWLGELSPYYQAGVHAGYTFTNRWYGELHVLNGWQLTNDNNDAKAIGGKIAYAGERWSASLNTFDGPELPDDDRHWRHFGDLLVLYKPSPQWNAGASLDCGHQELPGGDAANWTGFGGYLRYAAGSRAAVAVRIEQFDDPDNGISGTAQTLREATLTFEYRPVANLILKTEARRDHSTAPVFQKRDGTANGQTLVLFSAVATF